ncbi:MAG: peptidylprolyl isomerase [Burkholderiaceae bacterium]|nr:peptidylprolyl isomerase [Burkholderiaceae bacterium]
MKLPIPLLLALACMAGGVAAQTAPRAASPSAKPVEIDRVVAVVNTDVITMVELETRRLSVERQLRQRRIEVPPEEELRKQVLERLISDRALSQAARDAGLRVDDSQLDRAVARLAEENRATPAQLRAQLERDGISFTRFREEIREEMLISRLREREVDAKLVISEADVDAFLAEQRESGTVAPEYDIAQILLRIPEGASPEQIERQRLRGEEILRQLQRGGDFARLSAAFSDSPEAMSGGALGWRSAERLPQMFVEAVGKLKPGEVAPLLRSPNGFHVLRLNASRAGTDVGMSGAPVQQTRVRHILIRPTEAMPQADVLRRLRDIRERLLGKSAEFADMARQYSADGSATRGGELGWIYAGDTVPGFERAMDQLKPGEISEPVRTEFGFHLIQVLERRTDVASPERQRQAARMALRERRIEEQTQDWLRQVRDRTYVEYRDR